MERKTWTHREITRLIARYQESRLLWDVHCVDYRNRVRKQEVLDSIAATFSTDCNEITRKLHNLRSQFMQELKKMKTKTCDGQANEVYISWPYFSALQFIQPDLNKSVVIENVITKFDSETIESNEDSNTSQGVFLTLRKRKSADAANDQPTHKKSMQTSMEAAVNCLNGIVACASVDDVFEQFGKYVAAELRVMPARETILLQQEIQNAITKFKLSCVDNVGR